MKGIFPSFMPKTDEERIQNLSESFEELRSGSYYVTEKLDGSSVTFYYNNGEFGVCSRNLELLETAENSLWKAAREMDIEQKITAMGNVCLQGEIIGEGIQGNPYKLRGQKVYFFNMYNIDKSEYYDFHFMKDTLAGIGLDIVPLLDVSYRLPASVDELLTYADGKSALHANADREAIVIRSTDKRISFKVISNKFLLKEK
jgi:RNA ligase (TIGR02306 family)